MTRRRLTAWSLIAAGVIYLTVAGGGGYFGLYVWAFRVLSVVVGAGAVAAWLIVGARQPAWRPRTVLWPAIVACLVAMGVSTVASATPRLAFDFLAYAVILAGLYLLLQRLFADAWYRDRLGTLGVLLGFGLSGTYIGAILVHWIDFWRGLGHLAIPPLRPEFEGLAYGNPSTIATVCIVLWLAAAGHLGFGTSRRVVVLAVLGAMTAAVVFLSGSRGAWVGLALAMAVVIPAWLTPSSHRDLVRAAVASRRVRLAGAAAVVSSALVLVAFLPAIVSRVGEHAADTRTAFYQASLRMFVDHPLAGLGPGTWPVARAAYTDPAEADYYIPHAHNIYLQTLAELGLVGAFAGLIMAVSVGLLIRRALRSGDGTQRRIGWAAVAAMAYLGAHQIFDFYPNMPAIGFCLALIVARLDAAATDSGPIPPRRRAVPVAALALGLGVAMSAVWLVRSEAAASLGEQATDAANKGSWAEARAAASEALRLDPDMAPYLFTAGLAAAHTGDLANARDLIERAARIDDFPTAWIDVASLESDLGNPDAARAALARGTRLGFQQPQLALDAAELYLKLGDPQSAVEMAVAAIIAAPSLAADRVWDAPRWQALREDITARALSSGPPDVVYISALSLNRIDDARHLVAAIPEDQREIPGLVVAAWSGDVAAFGRLHSLAVDNPLDQQLVALCRWVAQVGSEAHPRSRAWTCDRAGWSPVFTIVESSGPPPSRVVLPGPNSPWHFQYAYRRTSPFDELVPGLPHLAATYP